MREDNILPYEVGHACVLRPRFFGQSRTPVPTDWSPCVLTMPPFGREIVFSADLCYNDMGDENG